MSSTAIKEILIDNEYVTLRCYPETKIVYHTFHKYIYGEEFRNVLNSGLDALKRIDAHKWLSDDRGNSALPTDDVEWCFNDWFPRVWASGWQFWAIVMPDKVAGQLNMNRFAKRYIDQGLTIKVFSDPDEALAWLEAA